VIALIGFAYIVLFHNLDLFIRVIFFLSVLPLIAYLWTIRYIHVKKALGGSIAKKNDHIFIPHSELIDQEDDSQ
jgi:hypothetical protein